MVSAKGAGPKRKRRVAETGCPLGGRGHNIVEGASASGGSKEMELKLTKVARASLDELLEDYGDFLRVRDLKIWDKDSKEALFVRKLGGKAGATFETFREFVATRPGEVVANIAICLIHQANYLLDQQLKRLQQDFLKEGGIKERMTKARLEARERERRELEQKNRDQEKKRGGEKK